MSSSEWRIFQLRSRAARSPLATILAGSPGRRGMICGSMAMLRDTRDMLEGYGLIEGSNAQPGSFVVERAFVD